MRRSKAEKAVTHSKILKVAARRLRERGLQGVGVADLMKEAGTSAGGFYKHFNSRDDLVVEALAECFKDLDVLERKSEDTSAFMSEFISEKHRDKPSTGCAITAFAGEIGRASPGVRTIYTQRVKHTLGYFSDHLTAGDIKSRRDRAILLLSAGIGGVSLARAVNDRALSKEIIATLRHELIAFAEEKSSQEPTAKTRQ